MHKIPVTVITGFLGAGKTTLIRHLLQNNGGRRIAVLVNEFGEVGIDGELLRSCQVCDEPDGDGDSNGAPGNELDGNILELANGCLCCTVQEEFLPTMQELLKRRDRLDCIVIETSGLALPKPLVQAFRWPEIRHGATVDGVLTVVDCEALAAGRVVGDLAALERQRQADDTLEHETPLEELFEDQLACADLVLLTKADCVDGAGRDRAINWLQSELRPGVKILPCDRGQIDPAILLGFNAAVEDDLAARPSHHDGHHHDHGDHEDGHDDHDHHHDHDHDHDDEIESMALRLDGPCDPAALVEQLQALVRDREIYRIKGFVNVADKPMRLVLQGVGQRFETFYDRRWRPDEPRRTQLAVIGRNLDPEAIRAAIAP
ncbi:MAG: cobalamin biosynthesis protein CobW [Cyanobacteria bacterium]|nr:cobalamin biosynthesis protein CobW [Cyanobacteriota bacterium]